MKTLVPQSRQHGMTMVVVMALLAVMCVLMLCAAQSISFVKRELKLIEKKQVERCAKGLTNPQPPIPSKRAAGL